MISSKETPKRVLIFSLAYHPCYGGAELALREITNRIDPKEIEFHMVTVDFGGGLEKRERIGNILVHRIGPFSKKNKSGEDFASFPHISFSLKLNKIFYQFIAPFVAHRLYKKYRYEAIWAMMPHSTGIPSVLFHFLNPGVSYTMTLQEGDTLEDIKKSLGAFVWLYALSFKHSDIIQTISTYLARMAREMGYRGKIEVIPNGASVPLFSKNYSPEVLHAIRGKHALKRENRYLITTSRLVYKNGIDDVIRSLALLPENVHFLVIGRGVLEEPLKDLARKENVSRRVHFLGEIPYEEIPKYLRIANIFIRPSRSEGMGSSFIEAMAAGIPIIGTAVGGIPDFLKHEKTGLFCEVGNPSSIARQVERLLDDYALRSRVIENAQNLACKKYDWDIIAHDMREKIFEKLFNANTKTKKSKN